MFVDVYMFICLYVYMFMDVYGCLWMFMVNISTSLCFFPRPTFHSPPLWTWHNVEILAGNAHVVGWSDARAWGQGLVFSAAFEISIIYRYIIILLAVFSPILYQLYHLDRCILTLLGCLDVDSHSKKTPSFTARWRRYWRRPRWMTKAAQQLCERLIKPSL